MANRARQGARIRPWWALTLLVTLVATACEGGAASEGVADFSEIAAAGPAIEVDPSGATATLRVTTTIDAVCAVTYGTSADLGHIATDDDMGGGAHRDHLVHLPGLHPDTEYFYRLQGVGEDGVLYQSEMLQFRTPAASSAPMSGDNVAIGATVVDVSSEFSAAFAATNALDDDPATEWSTRGDGDDAYLVIDLGRIIEVVGVGFHTREMSDGSGIARTFTVTVDGDATYGPFPVGRADASFAGRVVRFDVQDSTGGNTGASRVEVFEAP